MVAPSVELDPGPHTREGISLSFWTYVKEIKGPLDAAEAGRRLQARHEALADYEGQLEPLGTLAEAEHWVNELAAEPGATSHGSRLHGGGGVSLG